MSSCILCRIFLVIGWVQYFMKVGIQFSPSYLHWPLSAVVICRQYLLPGITHRLDKYDKTLGGKLGIRLDTVQTRKGNTVDNRPSPC